MKRPSKSKIRRAARAPVDTKTEMIRLVTKAANKADVPMAIGGGIAVAAQGYRRDTADVDAFFRYEDRQKLVRAFRQVARTYNIEQLDDSHWIAVPPGGDLDERIDLMFSTGDPEESAIEMAEIKKCRGTTAPVFPVVWLVVCKYLADRDSVKDWLDIYELYKLGTYDISQVTKRLRQMGDIEAAKSFPLFMDRLSKLKDK